MKFLCCSMALSIRAPVTVLNQMATCFVFWYGLLIIVTFRKSSVIYLFTCSIIAHWRVLEGTGGGEDNDGDSSEKKEGEGEGEDYNSSSHLG